jgi:hypothetical protein
MSDNNYSKNIITLESDNYSPINLNYFFITKCL